MTAKPTKALLFRESLDQGLAEIVAGLDREHYPDSLLEIIEAVLLDISCPRGFPLLAFALNGAGADAERCYQAAEILWQGLLLTALLAADDDPSDGLAAGLTESYDTAHLLLAADTLLTLPFELCSGEIGAAGAGRLAQCARSALDSLEGRGAEPAGLGCWRPYEPLLAELCPGAGQKDLKELSALIDLAYAGELSRWLGPRPWLKPMREQALKKSGKRGTRPALADVRELLANR